MTDPERISRRASGLSGELLRAGLEEQPSPLGLERTLLALGSSAALVATSAGAHAAATGVPLGAVAGGGAATGGAAVVKATSAALLLKWVGIGVACGVGLAGAASAIGTPSVPGSPAPAARASLSPSRVSPQASGRAPSSASSRSAQSQEEPTAPPRAAGRFSAPLPILSSTDAVGAPLAAEVTLVDDARAALRAGQSERALSLLTRYEREFPSARLLPEALFLKMEACERSGRASEARNAALQLLRAFPTSPHAARARELLEP